MLRRARLARGLSQRMACRACGNISRWHLRNLEGGLRCPSESVAQLLIERLDLTATQAGLVRSAAIPDVGRDYPGPPL